MKNLSFSLTGINMHLVMMTIYQQYGTESCSETGPDYETGMHLGANS